MRTFLAVLALLFVACASNPPPAATNAPPSSASSAPSSSSGPSSSAAPNSGGGDAQTKPTIESQREPFMQGCLKKVQAPDYCACGFDQFKEIFKDVDLEQDVQPNDPRLTSLREKTLSQCGSKLTDEQVKGYFLETCTGGDAHKKGYCECSWTAMRKHLELADFVVGDPEGARFMDAKKAMAQQCKGRLPADVAKADFMTGCAKGDGAQTKICECLWKKVRAKYAPEEIAAGVADVNSVPGLSECKAGAK